MWAVSDTRRVCIWGVLSPGMLRGLTWCFVTTVLGQPIGPILKGQALLLVCSQNESHFRITTTGINGVCVTMNRFTTNFPTSECWRLFGEFDFRKGFVSYEGTSGFWIWLDSTQTNFEYGFTAPRQIWEWISILNEIYLNINPLNHSGYSAYRLLHDLDTLIYPKFLKQFVFLNQTRCVFCEVGSVPFVYYVVCKAYRN
jgi:hypothetical protein